MGTTVTAIYEKGALRLLEPVKLAESSQVQVQILARDADAKSVSFGQQLASTRQLLAALEDEWDNTRIREILPSLLQADLRALWHLAQPSQRELCALLQLSAAHLQPEHLTHEQVAALRFALDRLEDGQVTEDHLRACHLRLTEAGLPAAFALDNEARQSYLDEL